MRQAWHIAVHVNANTEFIDAPALMAFRERCEIRGFPEPNVTTPDLLYIPPQFDRRTKRT